MLHAREQKCVIAPLAASSSPASGCDVGDAGVPHAALLRKTQQFIMWRASLHAYAPAERVASAAREIQAHRPGTAGLGTRLCARMRHRSGGGGAYVMRVLVAPSSRVLRFASDATPFATRV
ncbi:hypothetical protein OBBRIDRAFT_323975 [Obba rivulosa]|uniref:Uncharacterized protein n=1 Tax=Obba rivulosa TaxID=1052685 RepID=A0A8E2ANX0_9APHY|nr:hypothetical protein OBBRIDRAFT_323975 [Obba rivulosa]